MPLLLSLSAALTAYALKEQRQARSDTEGMIGCIQAESLSNIDSQKVVEFLPHERNFTFYETPISTVTFFDGDSSQIEELLHKRLEAILKLNPWLTGYLVLGNGTKGNRDICLWYNNERSTSRTYLKMFEPHDIPLCRDHPDMSMHLNEMGELLKERSVLVRQNLEILSNPLKSPLFQVSIIPDDHHPKSRFAMVVSMSHILGDAHTFYKLHDMLASDPPSTINPKRKVTFNENVSKIMGPEDATYLSLSFTNQASAGAALYSIKRQFFHWKGVLMSSVSKLGCDDGEGENLNGKFISKSWGEAKSDGGGKDETVLTQRHMFIVSNEWLKEQKDQFEKGQKLSDNDVLVSWFFLTSKAEVGLMPLNFRNPRFCNAVGVHDEDAGNYQIPLPFTPNDYKYPNRIRSSVERGRRSAEDQSDIEVLPPFLARIRFAVCSNWSTFYSADKKSFCPEEEKEVEMEGDKEDSKEEEMYKQVLHLPILRKIDYSSVAPNLQLAFIFQAQKDRLGILVIGPKQLHDAIDEAGIVEESISRTG